MKWIGIITTALALFLAGITPVTAQEPAPPPPEEPEPREVFEERIEVAEVLLEVQVTDAHGRTVAGLDREDLVVLEDGKPMEIVYLTFVEQGEMVDLDLDLDDELDGASIDLGIEESDEPRHFILFFHQPAHLRGLYGRMVHAGKQAGWWLRQALRPGEYAAVVGYDNKLKLYQDFTGDKDALATAAIHAAGRSRPRRLPASEAAPSLFARLPESDRRLLDRTTNVQKGLEELARAASVLPGRKHLFFFSLGGGVAAQERGFLDWDTTPTMVSVLNDADVAVHSIYIRKPGIGPLSYSPVLDGLSRYTGGVYQGPRNFFTPVLRETSDLLGAYYLLSYRTRYPAGTSGYREIEVRTQDPDHVVYSRQGYFYGTP